MGLTVPLLNGQFCIKKIKKTSTTKPGVVVEAVCMC